MALQTQQTQLSHSSSQGNSQSPFRIRKIKHTGLSPNTACFPNVAIGSAPQ